MPEVMCLRPSILVSMSTTIKGNKTYVVDQIETEHIDDAGQARAKWETTKIIADPVEHKLAVKTRGKVRSLITGVCAKSAFGLLCPEGKKALLDERIAEAEKLVEEFNETANMSQLKFYILRAQVAQDDVQAARAISGELQELIEKMQDGLAKLDVESVREACNQAMSVGQMLSVDAKREVDSAVKIVRATCREIKKAGEDISFEIEDAVLDKLDGARTSFLNLEGTMLDLSAFADDEDDEDEVDGRAIDTEIDLSAMKEEVTTSGM